MKTTEATSVWGNIPLLTCINLREREDRLSEVSAELRRVGMTQVEFFRSDRQADNERGCGESHLACLSKAVEHDVPYALIMEDDILFQPDHETHLRRILTLGDEHPECNFLHLGGLIFRPVE
ncbi:MAG: glycosyltransferase family 25 protein [Candidatus Synoicihabitans palmerolidicus]|nr:glycosyltransferase family 25 protein [Candidatus Synoicihabitans palmerolidicus]MCC5025187.1 glycosyltransferase family 25 protein [Candidatus Synoicihabitans palmerolidicus]MCC5025736.1 glycosyltransferase family 25 protein [Candidatus Synoicihabitans palmerolidicus]MCC5025865.1 glycosyltransferase family 25 protein [Candidatus Synoicihabitans palmerolidicus]MCC5025878.1 glycosyltransferase family 25 protein [Candidatus Synoicihabitans palmerolidicus]